MFPLQYDVQAHVYEHIHSTSNNLIDFWTYEGIYFIVMLPHMFVTMSALLLIYCRCSHLYAWRFLLIKYKYTVPVCLSVGVLSITWPLLDCQITFLSSSDRQLSFTRNHWHARHSLETLEITLSCECVRALELRSVAYVLLWDVFNIPALFTSNDFFSPSICLWSLKITAARFFHYSFSAVSSNLLPHLLLPVL